MMRIFIVLCAVAALAVAPGAMTQEDEVQVKPDFSRIDKNGDGELTLAEISGCVEAYPELGLLRGVFTEIDLDEDGVVTVSEYEVWVPMGEETAGEIME